MTCDEVKLYIQYYQQDKWARKVGPTTNTLIKKLPSSVQFILHEQIKLQ